MDNKSAVLMDEELPILSTTWFPSPEKANTIKSRTIAQRAMIRQIEEEIVVLQARRHALVKAYNVGRAVIAPIRKLPVEILADIFVKCIPPLPTKCHYMSPMSGLNVRPQDVGKLLGTVCRVWHTIVNDEPRIWSAVLLNRRIEAPEDINQLLKKSKSQPLDIFVEPGFWFPTVDWWKRDYNIIFEMLRNELWRTRSFIADMRLETLKERIFPGFSINAPVMQTFTLIRGRPIAQVQHDLDTFHCPRLCSISLKYSPDLVRALVANPVQTVRHLEVTFYHESTALHLQLLSVLPNLVSLHWSGMDYAEKIQEAPSTVVLHSLKSLRFRATRPGRGLLSFIHVPSLEFLELLIECSASSTVQEIIGTLCGDGVVKLRHLHIFQQNDLYSVYGPDVGAMLGQLNCLETLIVERSAMWDDLLTALSPQDRDFSSVCPRLTTLVILDSEIPPDPFVFVHRRTRADLAREEAVPGLVTSLKLHVERPSSNYQLCMDFAQTHSATIRIMSLHEYVDTSVVF